LQRASREQNIKQIAIAGGVSANSVLRKKLKENQEKLNWKVFIPKFEYTTDNAAMIAITGYLKFKRNILSDQESTPYARQGGNDNK